MLKQLAIDMHDQWTFTSFSSTQSKSPWYESEDDIDFDWMRISMIITQFLFPGKSWDY